jgi:diguanylate cyclase (GGDEF)-like protein
MKKVHVKIPKVKPPKPVEVKVLKPKKAKVTKAKTIAHEKSVKHAKPKETKVTKAKTIAHQKSVKHAKPKKPQRQFESRLANELDTAEGEREVIDVIERSFSAVPPDAPVELILVDDSHTIMGEMQLEVPTDTLTGLLSLQSFSEEVAAVPARLFPVSVAMADLDHFQAFNDRYGRETGDRALRLFALVLRDSLRNSDVISRCGGDEFAIAFPDCSAMDAFRVLETLRTQFDDAIIVGGLPTFTASFGVTEGEPGEGLPAVLRRADDALLLAKHQGGDRVVLYDPGVAMNGAAG